MAPEAKSANKRSRPGNWILARKITQYSALTVFIILFIWSQRGGWPGSVVNLPMRFDPLLVLAHLFSSRIFLTGSALALVTVILTLVFGRAWCGWICPLGTILDIFSPQPHRAKGKTASAEPGQFWRGIKYGLLLVILSSALLGNLSLLIFDPLTIFFRTLSASLWPALDQIVTAIEAVSYRVPLLSGPVSIADAWLRPKILPSAPVYYKDALLFASLLLGIILLNWVASRFWCRYLCPLGGLLGLLSKFALLRRAVGSECKGCTLCTQSCPTGTINPAQNYASDPSECTMCLDCLEACPRSSITFQNNFSVARWQPYDPGRRQALLAMAGAIAGVALLHSEASAKREHPFLLRPPGGRENNLLSKCVRCAECMRACPTSALQPAISEAGPEGLWTPIVIPRLGYCDYSCNACGLVCPVAAIPALPLETKRQQVIGLAYIDQNRCLAWSDHSPCIVCEEMCPLPDKAIHLQDTEVVSPAGEATMLQLPYVLRDRCIGCGLCEYKCPVNGEAAIRVYVPGTEVPF